MQLKLQAGEFKEINLIGFVPTAGILIGEWMDFSGQVLMNAELLMQFMEEFLNEIK